MVGYNTTDFNQTDHTVGHAHITTDVTIGDVSLPMDHQLGVQSQQAATVVVESSSMDAVG